ACNGRRAAWLGHLAERVAKGKPMPKNRPGVLERPVLMADALIPSLARENCRPTAKGVLVSTFVWMLTSPISRRFVITFASIPRYPVTSFASVGLEKLTNRPPRCARTGTRNPDGVSVLLSAAKAVPRTLSPGVLISLWKTVAPTANAGVMGSHRASGQTSWRRK